jgi:hypothetical protein
VEALAAHDVNWLAMREAAEMPGVFIVIVPIRPRRYIAASRRRRRVLFWAPLTVFNMGRLGSRGLWMRWLGVGGFAMWFRPGRFGSCRLRMFHRTRSRRGTRSGPNATSATVGKC